MTASRINSKWKIKTDTLDLAVAVGSQTGAVIRGQVKTSLMGVGYKTDWKVIFIVK